MKHYLNIFLLIVSSVACSSLYASGTCCIHATGVYSGHDCKNNNDCVNPACQKTANAMFSQTHKQYKYAVCVKTSQASVCVVNTKSDYYDAKKNGCVCGMGL